ncbi:MAG: phosphoadenosine phosphosulfate reductase family protein [Ruminiclostridium sp.]|nr:phosphoadenosine phosphosulfate reductase family protein [Ruminiclostridium sp.]
MSELQEKERIAIERLKAFEPDEPYHLCYSGGKDSDVIRILAQLANVKHELHHNLTSVDAPETVYYVKSIPDMHIDIPHDKYGNRVSMWSLIVKKGIPPLRIMRYCCSELKEKGGEGRLKITGVRAAESVNRKKNAGVVKIIGKPKTTQKTAEEFGADYDLTDKGGLVMNMDNSPNRRLVEHCYRTTSTMINPIIDWTDADVWSFLHHYGCESNPLYQCGKTRVGCIGCPMATTNQRFLDFHIYPKYKQLYIKAFDKMLEEHPNKDYYTWNNGEDVFNCWLGIDENQMNFFEEET